MNNRLPKAESCMASVVTITHHEDGIVFCYQDNLDIPLESAQHCIKKLINLIQEETHNHMGFVGHIKASITRPSESIVLSATDGDVHSSYVKKQITVNLTAILFHVDENSIAALIESFFSSI